jgi:hypothetical protein
MLIVEKMQPHLVHPGDASFNMPGIAFVQVYLMRTL